MEFRTEIQSAKSVQPILHTEKIITIGSCFAENIGEKLSRYKFKVLSNPFGVLYNPVSILNSIKLVSGKIEFKEDDLVFDQDEWHSLYHHSDFSHHNKPTIIDTVIDSINKTRDFLLSADWIIITLGTSFVFKHRLKKIIVSNCHKLPQNNFEHYKLSLAETINSLEEAIEILHEVNPGLKLIFTISPVRHWKNGAVENQISKSQLLIAANQCVNQKIFCSYFPSYEIMMDDLRDYRFYSEDLLHPNRAAIKYIWEKFSDSYFNEETKSIISEIEKIVLSKEHKPRNPLSQKHRLFIESNLYLIGKLLGKYPFLDFTDEQKYFNDQLKRFV